MKYLLAAGAMALVSIPAAIAQQAADSPPAAPPARPAHYPAEAYATLPLVEGPQLSPDGKHYAAKLAIGGTQYFSVRSLAGDKPVVIGLGDVDLNWWRWVNNEWLIIGIGQIKQVEGDDWYISRVVGVNAATGKLVQLNSREAAQDGDDLVWVARDGTPRVMVASQTSIYSNEPGFWPKIEEIDVSTGRRKTVQSGQEGVMNWYADGTGTVRMGIGMSMDGRNRRLLYRASRSQSFKVVDRAKGLHDGLLVPSLFLADPTKALAIKDDENGYSAVYELDLTTMQTGKQVFASPGFDVGGLMSDPGETRLLGVSVDENGPTTRWLDPEMAQLQTRIAAKVKGAHIDLVSLSDDHRTAIVYVGGADVAGAWFVYSAADDDMALMAMNNDTLRLKLLNPVQTIHYKARDGLDIAAVLTLPRNGPRTNLPLILMPHGGPAARDDEQYDWWVQFLADRGYAVIQPNYRGSTGYGTQFLQKGEGQWGLAMQDDLNDAVKALAERGIADPKRVCVVGASYGGYAALRAAQRDGSLYRCAISYAGVSDLGRMVRFRSRFLGAESGKDWQKAQAPDFKAVSPLFFPEQFSIPTLIVHGKKDQVVPYSQSRLMADRLKSVGKPVEFLTQPLGDHHFSRQEDRLEFLKAMEAFLNKYNPA